MRQAVFNSPVVVATGGGSFTPPSAAIPLAAWYDPSDLTTLWKDTAATIPVTADGDVVACMTDKSGNGNTLTQGTPAARPVYHTSGGKSWLDFANGGSGAALVSSGTFVQTDGSGQHSTAAGAYVTTA